MKTTESGQMNQNTELVKRLEAGIFLLENAACHCEIMVGWRCSIHGEAEKMRGDIKIISTQERVIVELRKALQKCLDEMLGSQTHLPSQTWQQGMADAQAIARAALSKGSGQ